MVVRMCRKSGDWVCVKLLSLGLIESICQRADFLMLFGVVVSFRFFSSGMKISRL